MTIRKTVVAAVLAVAASVQFASAQSVESGDEARPVEQSAVQEPEKALEAESAPTPEAVPAPTPEAVSVPEPTPTPEAAAIPAETGDATPRVSEDRAPENGWWDKLCKVCPQLRARPWLVVVVPLGALFALVALSMVLRAMTRVR